MRKTPINARTFRVTTTGSVNVEYGIYNNIYSITTEEESITAESTVDIEIKNEKLHTVASPYKVSSITKESETSYLCSSAPLNKSYYYLLPSLGGTYNTFQCEYHLLNVYTKYDNIPVEYSTMNMIYLKYRYNPSEQYSQFESGIMSHPMYKFTIESGPFSTFVFKISDEFNNDVMLFNEGKYSKLSKCLKNKICYFFKLQHDSDLYKTLYKSEDRKKQLEAYFGVPLGSDAELDSKPFNEYYNEYT